MSDLEEDVLLALRRATEALNEKTLEVQELRVDNALLQVVIFSVGNFTEKLRLQLETNPTKLDVEPELTQLREKLEMALRLGVDKS